MKFRKKPVVIEATQWFKDGDHAAVKVWNKGGHVRKNGTPLIETLEGDHVVTPGDWIITGVKGENYPCKPDIFASTYEPAQVDQVAAHAQMVKESGWTPGDGAGQQTTDPSNAAIEREIVAKGKTAPHVTPADIEANIASEHYFTANEGCLGEWQYRHDTSGGGTAPMRDVPASLPLLTFCVLVLRNGFTVTGESACASPENFDAEIGRQIARQNAVQKIWPLMGYALKQQLHEAATAKVQPMPGAAHAGYSSMLPHQQRVVDDLAQLEDKRTKLRSFFDTPIYASLPDEEQWRLARQHDAMETYGGILTERISAFMPA